MTRSAQELSTGRSARLKGNRFVADAVYRARPLQDLPNCPSTSPLSTMNSINVIAPYKFAGRMWVFDDPRHGLVQEPFISGADAIIDHAVAGIPNAAAGFLLISSSLPFPGHEFHLEWRRSDSEGNWYYSSTFGIEGWLCPALLKYFDLPPPHICFQVKPKTDGA